MNSIAINTSQNVKLDFAVASIGDRMLAFFIDLIIKASYLLVLFVIFTKILSIQKFINDWDQWSVIAFFGIILLPIELYTLVFETLMEGQTPGKRMVHIKVVKKDGYQAKFSDYLIRWFFRLVDLFISSGFVGIITMISSSSNQRLGGMASGTAVISLKNKVGINHTILEELQETYKPRYQQVLALSDNDMQIIKNNFEKAISLNQEEVIIKIAEKVREITGIPDERPQLSDERFIETIIKDFNFYTGKESSTL